MNQNNYHMKRFYSILLILFALSCDNLISQTVWSVDDCMSYAMENNTQIKKQTINESEAKSSLTESKLAFLPSVSASTGLNFNFGNSIDPVTNAYKSTSNMSNSYGIYGGLNLFNGLQTLNGYRIAKVSKLREELVAEQIRNQVATQTMSAYYRAIFAYGAFKIAKEELSESRKMFKRKSVEYEIGLANISDLALLKSRVSQGEYNITNLEGIYRKSLVELKNQMYYPLGQELAIDTFAIVHTTVTDVDENFSEIYAIALEELPDFKITEAEERIAKLSWSTSKALLFPSLSLSGGVNTGYTKFSEGTNDRFGDQFENRMGEYVGVSMNIPLWGGLSRVKNMQRKKFEYNRIQIVKDEKAREIESLVFEALIDLDSYEKQCNLSETNVKANTLSYRTTEVKFNEGLSTVVDVQTVQTNLTIAKMDLLKAFLNYLMQRRIVDYYKGEPLIR